MWCVATITGTWCWELLPSRFPPLPSHPLVLILEAFPNMSRSRNSLGFHYPQLFNISSRPFWYFIPSDWFGLESISTARNLSLKLDTLLKPSCDEWISRATIEFFLKYYQDSIAYYDLLTAPTRLLGSLVFLCWLILPTHCPIRPVTGMPLPASLSNQKYSSSHWGRGSHCFFSRF